MKTNSYSKGIGLSIMAAILLGSSAYAGKIIGVTAGTPYVLTEPLPTQYGFVNGISGWNLDNVNVKITDLNFVEINDKQFYPDGTYDAMVVGNTFESEISTEGEIRGLLHGKNWPVGEPSGIKVVNDDFGTEQSGKSPNCIMTTSYLDANATGKNEPSGYLDAVNPKPTVCSSPFQTHKRFKINMQPTTVAGVTPGEYGKPIDMVFNLADDANETVRRYQVFQKINNYTGKRLDGYKIEVLDGTGALNPDANITFSLDLTTKETSDDESGYEATFSHGLWGPADKHFLENGFFDSKSAGFSQEGNNTQELIGGTTTLNSNYEDLFGLWLPYSWAPYGIFFDDDNDATTDAELVAFWGTVPNAAVGTAPAWHKGQDYNTTDADGDQSWAEPTAEELLAWATNPLYSQDKIEDTVNLGPNYVVEVGLNSTIGNTFTIRITPRVAVDQTAPNYIMDDNTTYIMPPTDYNGTEAVLVIIPAPYFIPVEQNLTVGVADTAANIDSATKEITMVIITTDNGDEQNITLTETDVNSSIFIGTIITDTGTVVQQDGTISVIDGTVVTATYGSLTKTTTAVDGTVIPPVDPEVPVVPTEPIVPIEPTAPTYPIVSSSDGGSCTFNPNSKGVDTTVLLMLAMGLLYPFRRRFIK